ncbi:MAG TPA: DoxX family protein [candidate division Zixibacteria bacterium]|nr:DoxX family protein [candidate division Zixibacteria bacterium]
MDKDRAQAVLLWVLSALMAVYFGLLGLAKLTAEPSWAAKFEEWGYSLTTLHVIGGLELVGAAGLLVPRIAAVAALVLGLITVGAAVTYLAHDDAVRVIRPLIFTIFLGVIAWRRRPEGLVT